MIWQAVVSPFVRALAALRRPRQVDAPPATSVSDVQIPKGTSVQVVFPKYPGVVVYGTVADSADLPARHRRVTIPSVGLTLRFPTADLRIVDEDN